MQQTIQILPCIDKFPKPNQDTLGVGSSEKKQTSWECNRAINCRVFRLKLKENIDSDQNKIPFHLMREKFPVFSTNSSIVINREWLFSVTVAFKEMPVTVTGNWTRLSALNKMLGAGLPQLSSCEVPLSCRGCAEPGGGKSPIFSALWRIMKYLVAHGGWEHLGILGVMALPAGAGILLLLVRVSPRWLSRREVWGDQRHLQACPVGERQNPAQMPNVLQELSPGVSDRTAPTLQVPRTSLVQRP